MTRKRVTPLALVLAALLLFSGCGGSKETSATADQMMAANTSADGGWTEEAKMEESEADATASGERMDDAAPGENGTSQELSQSDLSARKLIKTVSLSLETKEFDTMKTKLEESVTSYGGYIENSNFDVPGGRSGYRYYSLTVRVPSEKLDTFVAAAGEMGTLTNKSENVEDVTLDYVDKKAYKESLQVEYDRVTELLEKAEDLEQVLALESKLSQLRYEINSYESQLRTYDNLIDYSTVHIYISEVEYEKETSDTVGSRISNGFRSSLYAVRDFFVNLFVGLVSNLPVLILLAVLVILVILMIRKIVKMSRQKQERNMNQAMQMYKNDKSHSENGENTEKDQQ